MDNDKKTKKPNKLANTTFLQIILSYTARPIVRFKGTVKTHLNKWKNAIYDEMSLSEALYA